MSEDIFRLEKEGNGDFKATLVTGIYSGRSATGFTEREAIHNLQWSLPTGWEIVQMSNES